MCLCCTLLRSALPLPRNALLCVAEPRLRFAMLCTAMPLPCGASWRLAMPLLLLADLCLCFAWLRSASAGAFLCYANAMPCSSQRSHCNAVLNLALAAQSCALPCRCGSALCSALASLCFAVPLPSSALPCLCGSWLSFAPLLCLAILCLSAQCFTLLGLCKAHQCSALPSRGCALPLQHYAAPSVVIAIQCLCYALHCFTSAGLCRGVPLLCSA